MTERRAGPPEPAEPADPAEPSDPARPGWPAHSAESALPARPTAPAPAPAPRISTPALPDRGSADSDASWGERPELDDEERLRRDRPPHWGSL